MREVRASAPSPPAERQRKRRREICRAMAGSTPPGAAPMSLSRVNRTSSSTVDPSTPRGSRPIRPPDRRARISRSATPPAHRVPPRTPPGNPGRDPDLFSYPSFSSRYRERLPDSGHDFLQAPSPRRRAPGSSSVPLRGESRRTRSAAGPKGVERGSIVRSEPSSPSRLSEYRLFMQSGVPILPVCHPSGSTASPRGWTIPAGHHHLHCSRCPPYPASDGRANPGGPAGPVTHEK